jgi:class 3 adenylate cyclase
VVRLVSSCAVLSARRACAPAKSGSFSCRQQRHETSSPAWDGCDAAYRRQQELAWTEKLVEEIETALEQAGGLGRPERVPAMCFLDLTGYTRLTEEHGDQAAAALAESLAVLVRRSSREHGGVPAKWLGDGVMVHFREPSGAVLAALQMVEQLPAAGLPPAHVGVAAGPVVAQGGDYFGRTVNLAARIAAYASAGRVLVSEPVVQRAPTRGVTFVELGWCSLRASPIRTAAGGPPGVASDASAWSRPGPAECGRPSRASRDRRPRTNL